MSCSLSPRNSNGCRLNGYRNLEVGVILVDAARLLTAPDDWLVLRVPVEFMDSRWSKGDGFL